MDDLSSGSLSAALATLAKLQGVIRRAILARDKAYAHFEAEGISRRAVDRAIALLDTDANESHEEMMQAQALLRAMRAPVQIEFVGLYETPVDAKRALESVRDQGFWACFSGASRVYNAQSQEEREAWMAGYDEAAAALSGAE